MLRRLRARLGAVLDTVHRNVPRWLTALIWLALSASTLGMGAWVLVLYAGHRTRRTGTRFWGYVYLAAAVFVLVAGRLGLPDAAGATFLALFLIGSVHSAAAGAAVSETVRGETLRARPRPPYATRPGPPPPPRQTAIDRAQWVLTRREEAREILDQQPALAAELRIGRPDQSRSYDDGGLVDINHVPASVLAAALEMPADMAERIVVQRDARGGFSSPEELVVYCDLAPERVTVIRDRLIFQPR